LWNQYLKLSAAYQQHEFFYRSPAKLAETFSGEKGETQSVRVYKDEMSYKFEYNESPKIQELIGNENTSVDDKDKQEENDAQFANVSAEFSKWVQQERFPQFVKITRGKFNHLLSTRKLLVMAVLEENRIGQLTPDMEEFRGMVKAVQERNIERYRQHFQFGWTGSIDIANSVAMDTLALPNLLVINTTTYQHYLPYDEPAHLTIEAIQIFLDDILEGTAPVYGGSSYSVRLYRAYYEAKSNIVEMWKGNPALACVLFGLPFGFFCLDMLFNLLC